MLELRREYREYSLRAPVSLLVLGGVVAVVTVNLAAMMDAAEETGDTDSADDVTTLLLVAAGGGVVALSGLIWMLTRIAARKPLAREIRSRERMGRGELQWAPVPGGAALRVAL